MRKCRVCNTEIDIITRNHNAITCSDVCTAAKSKKQTRDKYLFEIMCLDSAYDQLSDCLENRTGDWS